MLCSIWDLSSFLLRVSACDRTRVTSSNSKGVFRVNEVARCIQQNFVKQSWGLFRMTVQLCWSLVRTRTSRRRWSGNLTTSESSFALPGCDDWRQFNLFRFFCRTSDLIQAFPVCDSAWQVFLRVEVLPGSGRSSVVARLCFHRLNSFVLSGPV